MNEAHYELPKTELWINGRWVPSVSGRVFETVNPATSQVITRVSEAVEEDIEEAVKAAR